MKVWIMRGLPGSGKSSWADTLTGVAVCSADHHHMVNGKYVFVQANASEAHRKCFRDFLDRMTNRENQDVVVDNTNTTAVELAGYVRVCEAFQVEYEIVFMQCDFQTACIRNVHNVPAGVIWQMHQNLLSERLPAWWKQRFVQ